MLLLPLVVTLLGAGAAAGAPPPSNPPQPKHTPCVCHAGAAPPNPPCCFEGHRFEPNELGMTPPRGWRSWQAYSLDVDQGIMEDTMRGMTKQRPLGPAGAMVSLAGAGYVDVGLDSGYEMVGHGYEGGCHTESGHMLVNASRFPSFNAMTDTAHGLGLTASWYLNCDGCKGRNETATGPT